MEIIDATLRASGWPDAATVLRERWIDAMPPFADSAFPRRVPDQGPALPFRPRLGGAGRQARDDADAAGSHGRSSRPASADAPFRLVTAPARSFLNTSFTEMASGKQREGRPTVLLHPDDAARLGIADGDKVRLGNARGEVVLHARISDGQQPGVLVAESIWPSECFEGGIGINALTSDDPGPPCGGAVFHDTAVWLRAEAGEVALAAE